MNFIVIYRKKREGGSGNEGRGEGREESTRECTHSHAYLSLSDSAITFLTCSASITAVSDEVLWICDHKCSYARVNVKK
jgi:hypothetical protein